MSDFQDDGSEHGVRQVNSQHGDDSSLHEINNDPEDSVFTIWENESAQNYNEIPDVEVNNQYHEYDQFNRLSPSSPNVEHGKFLPSTPAELAAALETEKEFLNFMSSLPKVQKDKDISDVELEAEFMMPVPAQAKRPPIVTNASHVGLNHLDNLCKMIEQLKELREQNNRLQKRVHYLEDVKALQDMHNDMVTGDSAFERLVLGDLNLSSSDLHLEEIPESPTFRRDSDESLDSFSSNKKIEVKDDLLDLPRDITHLRSSSDDDSRRTESTEAPSIASKEKKMPKTTWGKVKNIINYNKKDNVRKKSQSLDTPSRKRSRGPRTMPSPKTSPKTYRETTAIYDPEEYDIDCEPYDGDGSSWDLDGEGEAGIWINPKKTDFPPEYFFGSENVSRNRKKKKPHLTITVPSCEDISLHNINTLDQLPHREGVGKISPESTGSSKDRKHSPNYSTTPPSPRRTSHWSKVKMAFLTGHNQNISGRQNQKNKSNSSYISPPNSPGKKGINSFNFDGSVLKSGETDDGFSPDLSPCLSMEKSRVEDSSPTSVHGLQKNLMDLQKTLTGEFSKKLSEWEKIKKISGSDSGQRIPSELPYGLPPTENIPFEFRKKMCEWDKAKLKDKDKAVISVKDLKTKNYEEETLPPEFKKKLTEWQIRKALVGKCEQNVEEIQKNLGEDFNKKMAEWERMKAQAKATVESDIGGVSLNRCIQPLNHELTGRVKNRGGFPVGAKLTSLAGVAAIGAGSFVLPVSLDRKGSGQKVKKTKVKEDKINSAKGEIIPKNRNKELQWLEKELSKIDREKQRLEREKEKFIEREARLEKMKYAMKERQPETKEIYIKTATGEFRFEGISQTFTKKLYEWEERRGIRAESSTFVLLDPNYKAPGENLLEDKPKTPEPKRIVKSRSESSLAERLVASVHSNASTVSLNEDKEEAHSLQTETKAASEPTLPSDEIKLDRQSFSIAVVKDDISPIMVPEIISQTFSSSEINNEDIKSKVTYAPDEITRLIDSSESDDRYRYPEKDAHWNSGQKDNSYLHRTDSVKSDEDYRNLLHENMTLLGQLKEKENVCRAIETQMGDLDYKMDNVADQHIRTLERLHRQVNIMRKSESFGKAPTGENYFEETESERNRVLITQLKSRIAELEEKGDRLMEDKEDLECAFNLHKEQETEIAESLLLRIRELQEAGAEVNIQTVQCQTDDIEMNESHETSDEKLGSFEKNDLNVPVKKKRRRKREESKSEPRFLIDDESEEEHVTHRRTSKDQKDARRKRRQPSRNVQKLHNLTADLLFQAKRLEQGIIAKHNFCESSNKKIRRNESLERHIHRNRSLKSQRSLRLPMKENDYHSLKHTGFGNAANKTWSSIEAIGTEKVSDQWENKASAILFESQDLLKMNSDLTRMARELRKEMTNIWTFKDSTSESNSSDNRMDRLESRIDKNLIKLEKEDAQLKEEEKWLAKQATEVFKSIASLQSEKTLWPSSREMSIDEEASKLHKKESFCSTTDDYNFPENQATNIFNFEEITSNRNNTKEKYIPHNVSNEKTYTEREGTYLDDNFFFTKESTELPLWNEVEEKNYAISGDENVNKIILTNRTLFNSEEPAFSSNSNIHWINQQTRNMDQHKYRKNDVEMKQFDGNNFTTDTKENKRNLYQYKFPNKNKDCEVEVDNSKIQTFSKILPYETEINNLFCLKKNSGNGLRTRRVSDSQIDYTNLKGLKWTGKVKTLKNRSNISNKYFSNSSYFKRNQSANDVLLLKDLNEQRETNIFVPTKRTVFTVIENAGYIAQIKNSMENEDHIMDNDDISTMNINKNEDNIINLEITTFDEVSANESNLPNSCSNIHNPDERARKSNDPIINKDQQLKLLNVLHDQTNSNTPLLQKREHESNRSTPSGYKSLPRRNGNSEDNTVSIGYKAVIDIFSNRITRNQQLLMNPFSMGDPFIEVKRRQALSSDYIDVLNNEEKLASHYFGIKLNKNNPSSNSNYALTQSKSFPIKKWTNPLCTENDLFQFEDSKELTEEEVIRRKLQLKKAKEEFFQEMLSSNESASSSGQCIRDYPKLDKLDAKSTLNPEDDVSQLGVQLREQKHDKGTSPTNIIWPPPKPPRASMCGIEFRIEDDIDTKADRNSLLSNITNNRLSKSIKKMFRKGKNSDSKNNSAVEVLCRQSLCIDVNNCESNSVEPTSPNHSSTPTRSTLENEPLTRDQMTMTLPRGSCPLKFSHSSHSCPPTPIVQPKSKASSWFEKSCKILKGKTSSPVKKNR